MQATGYNRAKQPCHGLRRTWSKALPINNNGPCIGSAYSSGFGHSPDRYRIGRFITASGTVAMRNQSLIEAKGNEEANPTSNISSVPSVTPTVNGTGR